MHTFSSPFDLSIMPMPPHSQHHRRRRSIDPFESPAASRCVSSGRTLDDIAFEAAMHEWHTADPFATPPGEPRGQCAVDCGPSPGALLRMTPVGGISKGEDLLDLLAQMPPRVPPWAVRREELVALYLVRTVDELVTRRRDNVAADNVSPPH